MIRYEANGDIVSVHNDGTFSVDVNDDWRFHSRQELTELRHIIDQALNTSAEELGDVG